MGNPEVNARRPRPDVYSIILDALTEHNYWRILPPTYCTCLWMDLREKGPCRCHLCFPLFGRLLFNVRLYCPPSRVIQIFQSGFSYSLTYSSSLAYIVDANVGRSSTAVAANSAFRGFAAFVAIEIAVPLQVRTNKVFPPVGLIEPPFNFHFRIVLGTVRRSPRISILNVFSCFTPRVDVYHLGGYSGYL